MQTPGGKTREGEGVLMCVNGVVDEGGLCRGGAEKKTKLSLDQGYVLCYFKMLTCQGLTGVGRAWVGNAKKKVGEAVNCSEWHLTAA